MFSSSSSSFFPKTTNPKPERIEATAAEKIPRPSAVPVFGKIFWFVSWVCCTGSPVVAGVSWAGVCSSFAGISTLKQK